MTTSNQERPLNPSTASIWQKGLTGGLVGAAINLIVLWIAQSLMGGPLEITMPPTNTLAPLPWWQVVIATLVPAAGATVLYWLLLRFVPGATPIFWIAGLLFLLLSFFGPLGLPVAAGVKTTLVIMHIVAGLSILTFLTR
ncbi:MAG TPA: DUF6069 family protein [Caldilineaceae bacterium]|nr:DUF6069 family protein [Caldilineaceae bacterium]